MVERHFGLKALTIEPGLETGMPILYDNPAEVGADRIVNGIAAYEQFGKAPARPVVVVDFGTATTLDAISAKGEYLGGAICPGVQISADALFQRTAGCADRGEKARVRDRPHHRRRVGVGLFYGYVGMVEGWCAA
jgi:type III pantothenate kinase